MPFGYVDALCWLTCHDAQIHVDVHKHMTCGFIGASSKLLVELA